MPRCESGERHSEGARTFSTRPTSAFLSIPPTLIDYRRKQAKHFLYVLDEQGRRYPLLPEASFVDDADVTVQPGESVKSSLAFLAPPGARKLYLMGNAGQVFLPWVYLYFGSDVSLFHRPALLRIL